MNNNEYLALEARRLANIEASAIAKDLAEWSHKYSRAGVYGYSRQSVMDGELIALEERAKKWLAELNNIAMSDESKNGYCY